MLSNAESEFIIPGRSAWHPLRALGLGKRATLSVSLGSLCCAYDTESDDLRDVAHA